MSGVEGRWLYRFVRLTGGILAIVAAAGPGLTACGRSDSERTRAIIAALTAGDVVGFEAQGAWSTTTPGVVLALSTTRSQGAFSLSVKPSNSNGFTPLASVPLSTLTEVSPTLAYDVMLPTQQPNPNWYGTAQAYLNCPSRNIFSAFLGQVELTGKPLNVWNTVTFPVTNSQVSSLLQAGYSDLTITVVINVPVPTTGTYRVDNLRFIPVPSNGCGGKPNGTACTDNNACTVSNHCQNGTCSAGTPVVCAASDQCHVAGTCNPSTGICSNPKKQDGASCNDGSACTQVDICQAGTCTGTTPIICTASDQCHKAGICNPSTGICSNPIQPNGTACSDGNACTLTDKCQAGTCTGANPKTCTASDECHLAGVCDPLIGTCSNPLDESKIACTVTIRFEGMADLGEGDVLAVFSFTNSGEKNVHVPYGDHNHLTANGQRISAPVRRIPEWFPHGDHLGAVTYPWSPAAGQLRWTLGVSTAPSNGTSLPVQATSAGLGVVLENEEGEEQFVVLRADDTETITESEVTTDHVVLPDGRKVTPGGVGGTFSVSPDGAARYTIPLEVPRGRANMHPRLSLQYDHRKGDGHYGVGWSLGGVGSITRCKKTLAQDGVTQEIRFDSTDRFCLDGRRLVPVTPMDSTTLEFRPEEESYARVTVPTTAVDAAGPLFFEVRTLDGLIHRYSSAPELDAPRVTPVDTGGNTSVDFSGIVHQFSDSPSRLAWLLTSTADRHGNAINYHYTFLPHDSLHGVEALLSSITYTEKSGAPSTNHSITFNYSTRLDSSFAYVSGMRINTTRRCTSIETRHAGATVTKYLLTYSNTASISGRSLLTSVTRCDHDNICTEPTQFQWTPGSFAFSDQIIPIPDPFGGTQAFAVRTGATGDFDGDGRDDLVAKLQASPTSPVSWYVVLNTGPGFGSPHLVSLHLDPFIEDEASVREVRVADLDTDGRSDLIVLTTVMGSDQNLRYVWKAFRSNGDGTFAQLDGVIPVLSEPLPIPGAVHVADFKGDGTPGAAFLRVSLNSQGNPQGADWLLENNANVNFAVAPVEYNLTPGEVAFPLPAFTVDVTGSGRLDLLTPRWEQVISPNGVLINRIAGKLINLGLLPAHKGFSNLRARYQASDGLLWPVDNYLADLNDDGLVDAMPSLYRSELKRFTPYVMINTGTGFMLTHTSPLDTFLLAHLLQPAYKRASVPCDDLTIHCGNVKAIDWNQDGRQDFLLLDNGAGTTAQTPTPKRTNAVVYQSLGNRFTVVETSLPAPIRPSVAITLDANGDGQADVLQMEGDGLFHLHVRSGPRADLIEKILPAVGATETIEYKPLSTSAGIYTPGSCPTDPASPMLCVTRGPLAVSTVTHDLNRPGARTETYEYADGRTDRHGRGWLGVGTRVVTQQGTGIVTTTNYGVAERLGTHYPLAGRVTFERTTVPHSPGAILRLEAETTNFYTKSDLGGGRFLVQLFERHTSAKELPDIPLRSSIDAFQYDDKGAVKRHETVFGDGSSVVRAFPDNLNDEARWILHRPRRVEVTEVNAVSHLEIRKRQFDYHPETGALTDMTVEPDEATNAASEVYRKIHLDRTPLGTVFQITDADASGAAKQRVTTFVSAEDELYVREIIDAEGLHSERVIHPGHDQVVRAADANGVPTAITIDGFGRLKSGKRTGGQGESWSYLPGSTPSGRVSHATEGGPADFVDLDHLGRPLTVGRTDDSGQIAEVTMGYEVLGINTLNVSRPHRPGASAVDSVTQVDNLGRLLSSRRAGNVGSLTRTYSGRRTTEIDENGARRYIETDLRGRVVKSAAIGDQGQEIVTMYVHAPFGDLDHVDLPGGGGSLGVAHDRAGRRTLISDPDAGQTSLHYNGFGDVVLRQDGNNRNETTVPDGLGRPKVVTGPDGEERFDWDTAINGRGLLAALTTTPADPSLAGASETFTYDAQSRPATTTWRIGPRSYLLRNALDSLGRLDVLHYPTVGGQAFAVKHAYNSFTGALESLADAGNPQTVFWRALERDLEGQLKRVLLGNGVTETTTYDLLGRVDTLAASSPAAPAILGLDYGYDETGNTISRADGVLGTTETFAYDKVNRLGRWIFAGAAGTWNLRYPYDDNGNLRGRVVEQGPGTSVGFTYGEPGHSAGPHAITSSSFGSYFYDPAGQQISAPGRPLLAYTMKGLPSLVQRDDGSQVRFTYDPLGRRVRKADSSGSTTAYAGGHYEHRETTSVSEEIFNLVADGRKVAELSRVGGSATPVISYFHEDRLGSVVAITTAAGAIKDRPGGGGPDRRAYDPFGRRYAPAVSPLADDLGVSPSRTGFAALEEDRDIGLVDMNARLYDARVGRFISPDPIVGNLFDGQSFNRYSYVNNNPATLTDPTGLAPCDVGTACPEPPPPGESIWSWEGLKRAVRAAGRVTGEAVDTLGSSLDRDATYTRELPAGSRVYRAPSSDFQGDLPGELGVPGGSNIGDNARDAADEAYANMLKDRITEALAWGCVIFICNAHAQPGSRPPLFDVPRKLAEIEKRYPDLPILGISRQQSLKRIEGLASQVQEHLRKIAADPASKAVPHWQREVRAFVGEIERLIPNVGKKTGADWTERVAAWLREIGH
jgi:RHS repeat-associated protein